MDILGILPGILKAAGKILGIGKLGEAGDAITNAQVTPEQRVALQQTLANEITQLRQYDVEELKTVLTESLAEIQSPDKYVSRARPTGLYLFYLVSAGLAVAVILGVKVDPTAILTILGPLAGVGGTYVYRRTTEKLNGNGTSE